MTADNTFKDLYYEFADKYRREGLKLGHRKFLVRAFNASKEARKRYKNLKEPKMMSLETYIRLWIRETLSYEFAKSNVKKLNLADPPQDMKRIADFVQHLPLELVQRLYKEIYDAKAEDRKAFWDSFEIPVKKLEELFIKMVEERNRNNVSKAYASSIDFYLKLYKVPTTHYELFLKNKDVVISFCNQQLPKDKNLPKWFYSEYNNFPCFICRMKSFPFNTFNNSDLLARASQKSDLLLKFRNKIKIKEKKLVFSQARYVKEKDEIEIAINKEQNIRHHGLDLIHELGHAASYLKNYDKGKLPAEEGNYRNELDAFSFEHDFLEDVSSSLHRASFAQTLTNLARVLFEIELYSNPNQNPSKLFAESFNKCFLEAKQNSNPLFLIEDRLVYRPFSTFPHAVAEVNAIHGLINN